MPELKLTAAQRAERIACCKHIIGASWAYEVLKDVARTALATLEAEPWGYTSGIRSPLVNGAVVRDEPGINQFPVYLMPPAAAGMVMPDCPSFADAPCHLNAAEADQWQSGASWMRDEVLRVNGVKE